MSRCFSVAEDSMQNELKTGPHRQTHTDAQSTNDYDLFHLCQHEHLKQRFKGRSKQMWHWSLERACSVLTFWWDSVFMWTSRQAAMVRVQTRHMTCAVTARRWTAAFFFPRPWRIWIHTQSHTLIYRIITDSFV